MNKYDSVFIKAKSIPGQFNTPHDPPMVMATSAAAVRSNDTVVNSLAQELICGGKVKKD